MNLFVLFGDGAISLPKKWWKLCIMRYAQWCSFLAVFFFSRDTPSPNKRINSFLNAFYEQLKDENYFEFILHEYGFLFLTGFIIIECTVMKFQKDLQSIIIDWSVAHHRSEIMPPSQTKLNVN
jgi:phosphatidylglycerophosphatase A